MIPNKARFLVLMLIFSLVLSQVSFASNENQASSSESDGFWDSFDVRSVPRNCLSADNIITDLFTFFSRKGTTDASNSLRCYYESYGTVIDLIFYSIIFISLAEIGLKNTTHITESKTIPIALGIAFGIGTTIFGEVNGFSLLRDSGPFAVLLLAIFFVWLLAQLFEALGNADTKHAYAYSYALVGILLIVPAISSWVNKVANGLIFWIMVIVWSGCILFVVIKIGKNFRNQGSSGGGSGRHRIFGGGNFKRISGAVKRYKNGDTVEILVGPHRGQKANVTDVYLNKNALSVEFTDKNNNNVHITVGMGDVKK